MRLLLDEMISPRVSRELREQGHDAQAIKRDRPELAANPDREIVRRMAKEHRTIVTNDIADFELIHDSFLAAGERHAGMIFTFDETLPRNRASIPLWVQRLAALLDAHAREESLDNRVLYLP